VAAALGVLVTILALVLILLVIGGAGDGDEPAASPTPSPSPTATPVRTLPNLDGTNWRAITIAGASPVSEQEPTLSFAPPTIQGTDGCNLYSAMGSVVDGRLIVTTEPTQTRRACFGEVDRIADSFMAIIRAGGDLSVDESGQLLLKGPAGDEVVFVRIRRVRDGPVAPSVEPPLP
jgi:heat shock protein HslJ